MSSPLIARGETIGVLTVEHTGEDAAFADEDARILTSFAKHAAVALDNARRYENEVALARDLARANDELAARSGYSDGSSTKCSRTAGRPPSAARSGAAARLSRRPPGPTAARDHGRLA